jgi:hypothetical protein
MASGGCIRLSRKRNRRSWLSRKSLGRERSIVRLTRQSTLRRGIRLARKAERLAAGKRTDRASKLVAYGFLIRNRRIAEAIERLGNDSAYEGRMLLRTSMEIMFNHAWIRLRSKHSRATRFLAFQPLELLRVHASLAATLPPAEFAATKRLLEKQRRQVRHLFRFRDSHGDMRWAKSWASVSSLEARMTAVRAAESPGDPDAFMYGIYSWISSGVHGGPNSIKEMFGFDSGRLKVCRQPEKDPTAQLVGATISLAHTLSCAVEDLNLKKQLGREVRKYVVAVKTLGKPSTQ